MKPPIRAENTSSRTAKILSSIAVQFALFLFVYTMIISSKFEPVQLAGFIFASIYIICAAVTFYYRHKELSKTITLGIAFFLAALVFMFVLVMYFDVECYTCIGVFLLLSIVILLANYFVIKLANKQTRKRLLGMTENTFTLRYNDDENDNDNSVVDALLEEAARSSDSEKQDENDKQKFSIVDADENIKKRSPDTVIDMDDIKSD